MCITSNVCVVWFATSDGRLRETAESLHQLELAKPLNPRRLLMIINHFSPFPSPSPPQIRHQKSPVLLVFHTGHTGHLVDYVHIPSHRISERRGEK